MQLHHDRRGPASSRSKVKERLDMKERQKILMATDFSEASGPAWRRAVRMASESGAELFVAHVYAAPQYVDLGTMAPHLYDEWDDYARKEVGRKLDLLVDDASRSGVAVRALVLTGPPEDAIVEAAAQRRVDLLVLGTHGRTGMSRLFLGSVASRVVAIAPCPVLTVRVDRTAPGSEPAQERAMPALIA